MDIQAQIEGQIYHLLSRRNMCRGKLQYLAKGILDALGGADDATSDVLANLKAGSALSESHEILTIDAQITELRKLQASLATA